MHSGPRRARWRPRQQPGTKNKTEERFENEILLVLKATREVESWLYDSVKFKVGTSKCWYSVDYMVLRTDGEIEMIDVKGGGGWEDDALVKIKAASLQYPQFHWSGWTYKAKAWTERKF